MKYFLILLTAITTATFAQTPRINFKAPKFYPEGVAWDETGKHFFVGSVKTGTIATVNEAGVFKPFYEDSTLKSSFGMKVDPKKNKLWICTGDPTYSKYKDSTTHKKMIRLIALDLKTASKTDDIDLSAVIPGKHFANDLAIDATGTVYITDSYSPVIYRVAGGKPSVLAQTPLFAGTDVGLNGIVWHKEGYLLVVNSSQGQLYKIDLSNPANITKVQQPAFFPGGDGLLWDEQGNLVLVQNEGSHKIFRLRSANNWQSCELVAATSFEDRFSQPSTATLKGNTVFVLNSKLNELTDPMAKPSEEFSLQQAIFRSVK
jgi:sugar lactone lactonase YvrE